MKEHDEGVQQRVPHLKCGDVCVKQLHSQIKNACMIEYETLATRRLGFAVLLICAFKFLFATANQLDAAEKSNLGVWSISALSVSRIRPAATALSKFGVAVFAGGQSASFDDSCTCFVIVVFCDGGARYYLR